MNRDFIICPLGASMYPTELNQTSCENQGEQLLLTTVSLSAESS